MTAKEFLEQALKEENPDRPLIKEEIEAGVYSFALKLMEDFARYKCEEQIKLCADTVNEYKHIKEILTTKNACDK